MEAVRSVFLGEDEPASELGSHLVLVGSSSVGRRATAAIASGVPASAGTAPVKLNTTLTGTITWSTDWCCGSYFEFEGRAVLRGLGAVTFTGTWERGCSGLPDPTTICFRTLTLELRASDGATLSLSGHNEWVYPLEPPAAAIDLEYHRRHGALRGLFRFRHLYRRAGGHSHYLAGRDAAILTPQRRGRRRLRAGGRRATGYSRKTVRKIRNRSAKATLF